MSSQAPIYHYNNLFTKRRIIPLGAFSGSLVIDMKYLEELNKSFTVVPGMLYFKLL